MHRFVNHQMNLGEYTAEQSGTFRRGDLDVTPLRRLIEDKYFRGEDPQFQDRAFCYHLQCGGEKRSDAHPKEIDLGSLRIIFFPSTFSFLKIGKI